MDEVQVAINEKRIDSEDLILLNYCIDLLLDPTLPTEQFDINNYLLTSPKKSSDIQDSPEISKKTETTISKKDQLDQNCDVLSAAISESQIDREDFSTFKNFPPNESGMISKTPETATDANFQLTLRRDISEIFTK